MIDEILNNVAQLSTPGFFVTVEFPKTSDTYPIDLELFILDKLRRIHQGVKARRFAFNEEKWRMIITFFPTDRVVDERYALKNRLR